MEAIMKQREESGDAKGKFYCKTCALSFHSVKPYDKHRKTASHKAEEQWIKKERQRLVDADMYDRSRLSVMTTTKFLLGVTAKGKIFDISP